MTRIMMELPKSAKSKHLYYHKHRHKKMKGFSGLLWVSSLLVIATQGLNLRPIIGVLDQPVISPNDKSHYGMTVINANIVKWLESVGARVVPVHYNSTNAQLEKQFYSINGILFTGGGLDLATSSYTKTARFLFDLSVKENDKGNHFPLWGTCQGYQLLNVLVGGMEVLLPGFDSENIQLPLDFTSRAAYSRMVKAMPKDVIESLSKLNITDNLHELGVPPTFYKTNAKLGKFYLLISQNKDKKGREFGSVMEGRKYPFYGVQFHPERNAFEWNHSESQSHTDVAVRANAFFADFFVNEARKNDHHYTTPQEEYKALIYNWNPTYSGNSKETYPDMQTYYFKFE